MEKLNIAEILKDCPSGIKLYTTVWGDVEFIKLSDVGIITVLPISNLYNTSDTKLLYSDGKYAVDGECVLFPSKDQRDWSKFHIPFKDGDILTYMFWNKPTIYIYRENGGYTTSYYAAYSTENKKFYNIPTGALAGNRNDLRFATEEEKQTLFKVIKENGYKWNADTKTLEKLIDPKFKVGDKVKHKFDKNNTVITITGSKNNYYYIQYYNNIKNDYQNEAIFFVDQDKYELIIDKFDTSTLKPFDKVLVRQCETECWKPALWGRRTIHKNFPFITSFGATSQAIPFKNNEWLVGTTDDCDDYYKTWV